MESENKEKLSIKFLDEPIKEPEVRYPNSLTQEIREDYRKLNIPIKHETERCLSRINES